MPPGPDRAEALAPAKINLALHVLGRRSDGHHDLDTIAVFADFGDRLSAEGARELSLAVEGPFAAHAPADAGNLVLRAARMLPASEGHGAALTLRKHLPAGAGFGGGSADAAATLGLLAALWEDTASATELAAIAARLGADVPMCLAGRALRARGRGERIDLLGGWPVLPMVLVWPASPVFTAAAFAALERRENPPLPEPRPAPTPQAVATYLSGCRNDLEAAATSIAPEVGLVLERIRATPDCLLARMSGSGSGCFGLYPSRDAADAAAGALGAAEAGWWVRSVLAG